MKRYLDRSELIDHDHLQVAAKAAELAAGCDSRAAVAQRCFEFVRDAILHSVDHQRGPVTCKASEVLQHRTGYCYAKSHLLAALLRANGIPAGLCYQRLLVERDGTTLCLHGLNAVYLEQHGWYRIDARGNKPGLATAFEPPVERLAFAIMHRSERDLPDIYAEPLPQVVHALTAYTTIADVARNLPDI